MNLYDETLDITVHMLFKGAADYGDRLVNLSRGIDAAVILVSIAAVVFDWKSPLILVFYLLCGALTLTLKMVTKNIFAYSERCRILSKEALAYDKEVDPRISSELLSTKPFFSKKWALKYIDDPISFYRPISPPGVQRWREIYTYSAHFTYALMRRSFFVWLSLSVVLLFVSIAIMILIINSKKGFEIAELTCSVILLNLFVKSIENSFATFFSYTNLKKVLDGLKESDSEYKIRLYVDMYNNEIISGPRIFPFMYDLESSDLETSWTTCQKIFKD